MKCCKDHLVIIIQCQLTQIFLTVCCGKETTTFSEFHQFSFPPPPIERIKLLLPHITKVKTPTVYEKGETKYDKYTSQIGLLRERWDGKLPPSRSAATIEIQTPSYIPKELWSTQLREQSRCGKEHLGQELHRRT